MFKDIWYVTYDNSIELIFLEEALNAYNKFHEPHEINVIVNEYLESTAIKIRNRIKALPQDNIKVKVYIPSDILTAEELKKIKKTKDFFDFPGFGWVTQQYLKLAIYRKSNAKFSYVFDCKNIPVKPNAIEHVSNNHNFAPNPLPNSGFDNYKNYLRDLGILKNKDLVYKHRTVNTPFIFNNKILHSMFDTLDVFSLIFLHYNFLDDLEEFQNFLSLGILVSEIILYYSYIDYQGLDIDTDSNTPSINHWIQDGIKRPWMTNLNLEDWIRQHNYDHDDGFVDFPVLPYNRTYYITAHRRQLEQELLEDPTLQRFKNFIRRSLRDY